MLSWLIRTKKIYPLQKITKLVDQEQEPLTMIQASILKNHKKAPVASPKKSCDDAIYSDKRTKASSLWDQVWLNKDYLRLEKTKELILVKRNTHSTLTSYQSILDFRRMIIMDLPTHGKADREVIQQWMTVFLYQQAHLLWTMGLMFTILNKRKLSKLQLPLIQHSKAKIHFYDEKYKIRKM